MTYERSTDQSVAAWKIRDNVPHGLIRFVCMTDRRSEHPPEASWWKRLLGMLGVGGTSCDRQLTPDEDLQIAFQASADGDLVHAAFHVGCVLKADPTDRRALSLLERLVTKCREQGMDPVELAPLDANGTFSGTGATLARIFWLLDRPNDAATMLRSVAAADRETPWWTWALEWFAASPQVAAQVEPDQLAGLIGLPVTSIEGDIVHDAGNRAVLERALPAVESAARAHPRHATLGFLLVMTLRKLGRLDEANRLGDALWAQSPSYMSGIARAMARVAAGDVDGSVEAFEQTLPFDPDDSSIPADAAELLTSAGRYEEALRWAERAKEHDPERKTSSWGLSALLRHRIDGDEKWLNEYFELSRAGNFRPPGSRAASRLGPWQSYLPAPYEATINTARQMFDQKLNMGAGGNITCELSHLEAPSSTIAVRRALAPVTLVVRFATVPSPDPREPRGAVDWVLWRYEDKTAEPALAPPPSAVSETVAQLARSSYDLHEWAERSKTLGRQLAPEPSDTHRVAGELLAVMVHPPSGPENLAEWDWIRRVQVAAALVVAQIDGGWEDSERCKALVSLARGPIDWTTEAAIVALVQVFREPDQSEAARREIVSLFRELAHSLPDGGHCCFDHTLAWGVTRLNERGGIDLEDFEPLRKRLEETQ